MCGFVNLPRRVFRHHTPLGFAGIGKHIHRALLKHIYKILLKEAYLVAKETEGKVGKTANRANSTSG